MRKFFQKVVRADSLLILKKTKPKDKDKEKPTTEKVKTEKSKTKEKKIKEKKPKTETEKNVTDKHSLESSSTVSSSNLTKPQLVHPSYKLKDPLSWTVEDVVEWLREIGLGEYENIFHSNSIRGMDLPELEDDDLISICMNKIGHRKKLLSRIAQLFQGVALDGTRSPNSITNNCFSSAVTLPTSTPGGSEFLGTGNQANSVLSEPHLKLLHELTNVTFDCVYLQDKPITPENLKNGESSFQLQLRSDELTVPTLLTLIAQKLNIEKDVNNNGKKRILGWELKFMDIDGDLVTVHFDHHLALATRRLGESPIKLYVSSRDLPAGLDKSSAEDDSSNPDSSLADSDSSSGTDSEDEDSQEEEEESEETSE